MNMPEKIQALLDSIMTISVKQSEFHKMTLMLLTENTGPINMQQARDGLHGCPYCLK
jgi:hypothetical protein